MKKFVESITSMEKDFAQWYTDVVLKTELVDYSSVKGCMIIRPYGYQIWETIQKTLDQKLKQTGHENVYMPLFIPKSLLDKEKDHVEGFSPEVAYVTKAGEENLNEPLVVRPTSETLFCEHYSHIIQSYQDLPKKYNQWCSVVRWEKTTRPFLRTTEFLWQEGHTAHATKEEASKETIDMLHVYEDLFVNTLAIPVIKGRKTNKEKFAGALETYTIESLMHDGKALQSATSHFFGDGFAKAFNITYLDKNNKQQFVQQTSFGATTRLIGALIMVHGDDSGLVLPPKVAPIQVMIVPIAQHKAGVLNKVNEIKDKLSSVARVQCDTSDKMPGWKFNEYEMKGIPIRCEVGPRDIEKNQVVLVRRDTREKEMVSLEKLESRILELLDDIQHNLYQKALDNQIQKTYTAHTKEDLKTITDNHNGFIKVMWCGEEACENEIKEKYGLTSRCIPFDQDHHGTHCICCGKEAKHMVYFGRAY